MLLDVLLMVSLQMPSRAQGESILREKERALVQALSTSHGERLRELTDPTFTMTVQCQSGVNFFRIVNGRSEWIEDLRQLKMTDYQATVAGVSFATDVTNGTLRRSAYSGIATVKAVEWFRYASQAGPRQERLSVTDTWARVNGTWKLVNRAYSPKGCGAQPRLAFP